MSGVFPDTLRAIVESAYALFSKYRLTGPLNVCHCPVCMSDEHELALRTTPLREIPARLLGEYTNSAHGDGGDEFLHFLPRYFDLLAQGEVPGFLGRESCLRRLGQPECREHLSADESALCDAFFIALLAQARGTVTFEEWPVGRVADDILDHVQMVALAGGDLSAILVDWDADTRPSATLHIAAMIRRIGFAHLYAQEALWPWSDAAEVKGPEKIFQQWLERTGTATRVEMLFLETENRDEQRTLEQAIAVLDEVRLARKRDRR